MARARVTRGIPGLQVLDTVAVDGQAVVAVGINDPALVSGPAGTVGSHILADFYGVAARLLRSGDDLELLLRRAAETAGATVVGSHFHSFGDAQGITGVVLLAESHISIHTWPESDFAAVDIFMCGAANPQRALDALVAALAPQRQHVEVAARGRGVV